MADTDADMMDSDEVNCGFCGHNLARGRFRMRAKCALCDEAVCDTCVADQNFWKCAECDCMLNDGCCTCDDSHQHEQLAYCSICQKRVDAITEAHNV